MRRLVLFVSLLAAAGMLSPTAPAAAAVAIGCGATVTTDAYLSGDLVCPGPGIVIAGDGVTIDMRGHTLRSASGIGGAIEVRGRDALVKHGTVSGWGAGTSLALVDGGPVPNVTLRYVTLADNEIGAELGSGELLVDHSRVLRNRIGLIDWDGIGTTRVRWSRIQGNDIGAYAFSNSTRTSLFLNDTAAEHNNRAVVCFEGAVDMRRAKLRHNNVGFEALLCEGTRIDETLIQYNDTGADIEIAEFDLRYTIMDSSIRNNDVGVDLSSGARPRLIGNRFRSNGIGLRFLPEPFPGPPTVGEVERNIFHRNTDGIYIDHSNDLVIKANVAFQNRRWGIFATDGVDGGRNVAFANGEPTQCFGVITCLPRRGLGAPSVVGGGQRSAPRLGMCSASHPCLHETGESTGGPRPLPPPGLAPPGSPAVGGVQSLPGLPRPD